MRRNWQCGFAWINSRGHMQALATAEFTTLQLCLVKVSARVIESAGRGRLAFASACAQAELFRGLARALMPRGP